MNYDFGPEEQSFIDSVSSTAAEALNGRDGDDPALRGDRAGLLALTARLAGSGLLRQGSSLAGDIAAGAAARMAAVAAVAGRSPSLALAAEVGARLFGRIVDVWGAPDLKEALLPAITSGTALGAVALSEGAMNVENDPLATVGEFDGDHVVVTGDKSFVINAAVADWVAVAGRLEDVLAVFVVDAGTEGLRVGPPAGALGFDGAGMSSLTLDNCRVPRARVIRPAASTDLLGRIRHWENLSLCALSLGMMQAAFESARHHAKTHRSGGKPVIAYQAVGFKLSEMLTLCQTAQWLAYRAAWADETGDGDAETLVRCAKVFCSEAQGQVSAKALQVLSGTGVAAANPAERAYRGAVYPQIAGLSNEIARVRIGDSALGWK